MNKVFVMPQKACPVKGMFDVVICGGGPAGIGAAVAAAKNGASVAIVEQFGSLGGLATLGQITNLESDGYTNGTSVYAGGVFEELLQNMVAEKGAIPGYNLEYEHKWYPFDKTRPEANRKITLHDTETFKRCADSLMEKYGVKMFFFTFVTDVIVEDDVVKGIVINDKTGEFVLLAKRVIDATGDAFVASLLNVDCYVPDNSLMKLNFRAAGIDDVISSYKADVEELPGKKVDFYPLIPDGMFRFDMTQWWGNGTDANEISRGVIECRKQIPSIINWLKKNWPGCENMFLLNSAEMLNVENTRTERGLYTLTSKDITERQVTEDTIAISGCEMSSDSSDVERTYFGIPYRCLIPQTNIKNFLVAGRSISIDSEVKPLPISTYMSIGEAAGTASAMSISSDVSVREVDINLLRAKLISQGAALEPKPATNRRPRPARYKDTVEEEVQKALDLIYNDWEGC